MLEASRVIAALYALRRSVFLSFGKPFILALYFIIKGIPLYQGLTAITNHHHNMNENMNLTITEVVTINISQVLNDPWSKQCQLEAVPPVARHKKVLIRDPY